MSQSIIEKLLIENARMRNAIQFATAPDMWQEQADGMLDYRYSEWYVDVLNASLDTPATDNGITEFLAQGADQFAEHCMKMAEGAEQLQYTPTGARWRASARAAKEFAANLRAGTL